MPQKLKTDLSDEYQNIKNHYRHYSKLGETKNLIEVHKAHFKAMLNQDLTTEQFELSLNQIINLDYMYQKINIRHQQTQLVQHLFKSRNYNNGPKYVINHFTPIKDELLNLDAKLRAEEQTDLYDDMIKEQIKKNIILTRPNKTKPSNLAIYRMLDGLEFLINQRILKSSSSIINRLTPLFLQRKINQITQDNNGLQQSKREFEAKCKVQTLRWLKNIKIITRNFENHYDQQYQKLVDDIKPSIVLQPNLQVKGTKSR